MFIYRIRSFDEYKRHVQKNAANYQFMQEIEAGLNNTSEREFTVKGISYPVGKFVDFAVDYLSSDGKRINWRERLACPLTGLNNRLRCCIHVFDLDLSPYPSDDVYITEQVTPLFAFLSKRFSSLTGSEYLGHDVEPGTIRNDIRHEDMTNLSLGTESVDHYLTFECFEHIPDYKKAISEAYRVLKPGGNFLASFPFDRNSEHNLVKASLDEQGNIIHLTEPEYHGDPVSEKGILCFTIFGWEILDEFKKAGFADAYAVLVWSDLFGYLGGEQVFFIARKTVNQRAGAIG